jgi:hypothetical protein
MNFWPRMVVYSLAAWRITAYLVYEKGGQWIRDRAKTYAVNEEGTPVTFWGRVLSCFWCTGLYVSWGISLILWSPLWWLMVPIAVSGAVIILNHVSRIFRWAED